MPKKAREQQKLSLDESAPLSENPVFEGTNYESFENDEDRMQGFVEPGEPEPADYDDLLDSLPSKTMRRMRGIAPLETVRAGKVSRPGLDMSDGNNGEVPSTSWETFDGKHTPDVMLDEDTGISGVEFADPEAIRDMTATLDAKKAVRMRVHDHPPRGRPLSGWMETKFKWSLRWKRFADWMKDSFSSLHIWKGHLKEVQGVFGTGVLSYFTFLRWLLYLNLLMCFLTLAFLFLPQMLHRPSSKDNNATFSGIELLTGEGWFEHTELYYGQYTNETIQVGSSSSKYVMPYAYLFVGSGYILVCIVVIAVSMASSYEENFIIGSRSKSLWISKVFCSWDFGITNKNAANLKLKSIVQELLESLGDERGQADVTTMQRCCMVLLRILTNIAALGLMAGSIYLIIYVSDDSVKRDASTIKSLLPAITISAINLIMPSAFRILASIESYHSARIELMMTLGRTVVLKMSSLIVYVVALHRELTRDEQKEHNQKCWETFVGSAFYKLVIIDFITVIIYSSTELFRKVLASNVGWFRDNVGLPGFDISKNVLDLIFNQGVCWLGMFYCPLLPMLVVMKLIFIFYLKKLSVMRLCRPSMRPFKASKMLLLFLVLLSLMLILAMIVIGYVIMNEGELRPSPRCGPFRNLSSIYSIVHHLVNEDLPDWLEETISAVSSMSVIVAIIIVMSLLAYYFRMRKQSTEKKIKILKHQLVLAGQDKRYLILKLRALLKEAPHLD